MLFMYTVLEKYCLLKVNCRCALYFKWCQLAPAWQVSMSSSTLQNTTTHVLYYYTAATMIAYSVFFALNKSYLNTAPMRTWAPLAQSSGAQYSRGLWETPSRQGTKIMDVGTLCDVETESCPVRPRTKVYQQLSVRPTLTVEPRPSEG